MKFSRVRGVMVGSLGATILVLAACSSGPKSPPNAGQIIIQSAADADSTLVHQWMPDLTGPSVNLGPSYGGIAISPAGTPVSGAIYIAGKDSNLFRINPGSNPASIPIGGTATSRVQVAPHGAKNAGAALVLTDQGLATLQAGGGVTNIPIPDAISLVVAPNGASNAGTAYITSKTTSSLYIVDPLATSARTIDIGLTGGDLSVAPTGTPDVGTVFAYPDPDNLGDNAQVSMQVTEISPAGAVQTATFPTGMTIDSRLAAAVAPAKTKYAGCLYLAGASDGHLYQLSPSAALSSVPLSLDSSSNETAGGLLIADVGAKNAGDIYVDTSSRVLKVDPGGQVTTLLTSSTVGALSLLAIAPAKTATAGNVYVATNSGHDGAVTEIKPDDSKASFSLGDQAKLTAGIVAPRGTQLAGSLLAWGIDGQGVSSLAPNGRIGQLGSDSEITDVAVVPK